MELKNDPNTKIPPIPSNIVKLSDIPSGLDKMSYLNTKAPDGNFTNEKYFKSNIYSNIFNNLNNNEYINTNNTQNLPTILQNTVNSNSIRGNRFASGFFPDNKQQNVTINIPTRTEQSIEYSTTNDPHYPIPSYKDRYNKNFKIFPNSSHYLNKFPLFNIPYFENFGNKSVNDPYSSQFFQSIIYLPLILIIIYICSCLNIFSKLTFMSAYKGNKLNLNSSSKIKLKARKIQNIKSSLSVLCWIGILSLFLYIGIRSMMKSINIFKPECVKNPKYTNLLSKNGCKIPNSNNLNTDCGNCQTKSEKNINQGNETACVFGGKPVGKNNQCNSYPTSEKTQDCFWIDNIWIIYLISLLIGISIILISSCEIWNFRKWNIVYITLIINILLIVGLWLISYFSIKDCKDKNVWKWGLGSSVLETIFLGVTGKMLFECVKYSLS